MSSITSIYLYKKFLYNYVIFYNFTGIWWEFCGNHLSVLQKYVIRILSQPCGSSVCKRYQLRPKYGDDHAFMVNTMIMERHKVLETQMPGNQS